MTDREQSPPKKAFKSSYKIRFRDLDSLGHVNNAVYFSYMEIARVEYYQKIMGRKSIDDFDLILAHISCDYMRPLTLGETVEVAVWPSRIGNSSFTLEYEITGSGHPEPAARGSSVMVTYDYEKNRKKTIPQKLRAALQEHIGPGHRKHR